MPVQNLNEYEILVSGSANQLVCASTMQAAVESVTVAGAGIITQATLKQAGVKVNVPESDVLFEVKVDPAPAATAGCVALPSSYRIQAGKKVIMQAMIPSSTNWTFVGWFRGITQLAVTQVAEIAIAVPELGATSDVIVARFAPPVTP